MMKYSKNDVALDGYGWRLKLILEEPLDISFLEYKHIAKWIIEESLDWMLTNDGKLEKVTILVDPILHYWVQEEFEHLYPDEVKDYLFKLLNKEPDRSIGEAEYFLSRNIEINKTLFKQYLEISRPLSYKINTENYKYSMIDCTTGFEWVSHSVDFENKRMEILAFNRYEKCPGVVDSILVEVTDNKTRINEESLLYPITGDRTEFIPTYKGEPLGRSYIIKKVFLEQTKNEIVMKLLDLISIAEKYNLEIRWSLV